MLLTCVHWYVCFSPAFCVVCSGRRRSSVSLAPCSTCACITVRRHSLFISCVRFALYSVHFVVNVICTRITGLFLLFTPISFFNRFTFLLFFIVSLVHPSGADRCFSHSQSHLASQSAFIPIMFYIATIVQHWIISTFRESQCSLVVQAAPTYCLCLLSYCLPIN